MYNTSVFGGGSLLGLSYSNNDVLFSLNKNPILTIKKVDVKKIINYYIYITLFATKKKKVLLYL